MRGLPSGCVAFVLATACHGGGYFVCKDHGDCARADGAGACEPAGACSFPDDACASGRRYGDASTPSVAGECVADQGATTGQVDPSDATDTTDTGAPPSPTTAPSDAGDTTGFPTQGTTGDLACPADWWDCAWTRRQRLELARPIDTPLAQVPVLVLLGPQRVDYEAMQPDGDDLRFVTAAGQPAPFEVERWDPTATSVVWVGLDQLGGSVDHLLIYYGNPVAENAAAPADVWATPHRAVWHLEGDDPLDSTAHANHAAPMGSVASAPGQIGDARDFLGSSSRLDVEASQSLADVFAGGGTVSAWIRPRGWGGSDVGRIVDKEMSAGWLFFVGDAGRVRFGQVFSDVPILWTTVDGLVALHAWTHVAVTYDSEALDPPRFFVDGVEAPLLQNPSVPAGKTPPSDLDAPLTIGNRLPEDRFFDGRIDEVRIEAVVRDPQWFPVQVASMRDELFAFGPVEQTEDVR